MQLEVESCLSTYNCATISDYFLLDVMMKTKFGDVFKIVSFFDERVD